MVLNLLQNDIILFSVQFIFSNGWFYLKRLIPIREFIFKYFRKQTWIDIMMANIKNAIGNIKNDIGMFTVNTCKRFVYFKYTIVILIKLWKLSFRKLHLEISSAEDSAEDSKQFWFISFCFLEIIIHVYCIFSRHFMILENVQETRISIRTGVWNLEYNFHTRYKIKMNKKIKKSILRHDNYFSLIL